MKQAKKIAQTSIANAARRLQLISASRLVIAITAYGNNSWDSIPNSTLSSGALRKELSILSLELLELCPWNCRPAACDSN
jgi:hypothetical protein